MAEYKPESEARDIRKSFQDSQSNATDAYQTGVDLFRRGMERNIKVQKHVLDLAAQQNAETADLWRAMWGDFPGAESLLTLSEQTVENVIDLQRRSLDIIEGQGQDLAGSAKSQAERTSRAAYEMSEAGSERERKSA